MWNLRSVSFLSSYIWEQHCILYSRKFSLGKNFTKPSYHCITEIFIGINFCQCGKGCHIFNVILNIGQKTLRIKILPMRTGGEISENSLLAIISGYTVYTKMGKYILQRESKCCFSLKLHFSHGQKIVYTYKVRFISTIMYIKRVFSDIRLFVYLLLENK